MSALQKEAAGINALARRYKKIAMVFEDMPNRFRLQELLNAAGLTMGMHNRSAASVVLERDFRCISVGSNGDKVWKKPGATE